MRNESAGRSQAEIGKSTDRLPRKTATPDNTVPCAQELRETAG